MLAQATSDATDTSLNSGPPALQEREVHEEEPASSKSCCVSTRWTSRAQ